MASFLRYLYCEPSQLREYAELRMGLLKILLQPHGPKRKEAPSVLECEILRLLCDLIPHLQVQLLADPTFYKQILSKIAILLLLLLLSFKCANIAFFSIFCRCNLLIIYKSNKLSHSGRR